MSDGMNSLNTAQSPAELAQTSRDVSAFNKTLNNGKEMRKILNQADFLNLLITELKNQDPTQPMNDRESIAQMAQFSSLQQMQSMNQSLDGVSRLMTKSQAYSLIGRSVEIGAGDQAVRGVVKEVSGGDAPQVLINGKYYDFNDIKRVTDVVAGDDSGVEAEKGE